MTESLKIFVACFLGAGIGTLTALEINGYFWWFGLLIGGFVGYISYEFRLVLRACKNAWKAIIGIRITKEQWRSFGQWWIAILIALAGCISMIASYTILVVISLPIAQKSGFFGFIFGGLIVTGGVIAFAITSFLLIGVIVGELAEISREELVNVARYLIYYNPLRVCFLTIPKLLFQSTKWLYINTPKYLPKVITAIWSIMTIVVVITYRFVKHVFIEIHSDKRLLVGIDSAIGAIIGFFAGNVLIGAISGGVFGVLNYEILSKRILHLVPSKPKNS